MGTYHLKFGATHGILRGSDSFPNAVLLRNAANSDYGDLYLGALRAGQFFYLYRNSSFKSGDASGDNTVVFQQKATGVWHNVAKMEKAIFDVLECAMSNLPTSDPADGLSKIWSDSGVLTLGT